MKKSIQVGDINGWSSAIEIIQNNSLSDRVDFNIKISTYPSLPEVDQKALSAELNNVALRLAANRGIGYLCYIRFIPYHGDETVYKFEGKRNQ